MIKLEMTAAGLKCIFNGGGGCLTKQQMFDLIGTKSQSFNLQKRKFDLLFFNQMFGLQMYNGTYFLFTIFFCTFRFCVGGYMSSIYYYTYFLA